MFGGGGALPSAIGVSGGTDGGGGGLVLPLLLLPGGGGGGTDGLELLPELLAVPVVLAPTERLYSSFWEFDITLYDVRRTFSGLMYAWIAVRSLSLCFSISITLSSDMMIHNKEGKRK